MLKYVALALVAVAGATPALAQDAPDFTGFRVEALLGYDRVKVSGIHEDGVMFGGAAGYDFQTGGVVLGIEAEATLSTTKECAVIAGSEFCDYLGRDLYAGVRIGVPVGDRTLIYVKGGYTNAQAKASIDDITFSETLDGLRAGVGVEQRISDNAFFKFEYRYSNYEFGVVRHQGVAGLGLRF